MQSYEPADAVEWLQMEFIRRRAKNAGFSMRAFAKMLGVTSGRLSEIFSRKRRLTAALGARMAATLFPDRATREMFLNMATFGPPAAPAGRRDVLVRRDLPRAAVMPAATGLAAEVAPTRVRTSTTIATDAANLPLVQELTQNFCRMLGDVLSDGPKTHVYRLDIQFSPAADGEGV
jgi:plasmid maintenance system antidote protein VapI